MNYQIVNDSGQSDELITREIKTMIGNLKHPPFLLLVASTRHNGFCITFPDGVTSVIYVQFENIEKFRHVFRHEFVHLLEHQKGVVQEPMEKYEVKTSGGMLKKA